MREIKDVKSKLDALSRKAAIDTFKTDTFKTDTFIDTFKTGISYLYKAIESFPGAATRARQRGDDAQLREAVSLPTSPAAFELMVVDLE